MRLVMLPALLLAQTAAAQDAPVWSPEAVANLKGFVRGFSADCAERCATSDGGPDCAMTCTCLVANLSYTLDPRTLEAGGRSLPTGDDITAFVADNRAAFASAFETCGPLPE